jgi:hypothetical protein
MFITIEHDIHDPAEFQARAERAMSPPEGLHVHQFLPASGLSHATCLYEAAMLEEVRAFVNGALGPSSTQRYFPVARAGTMGLPARQPA